jgi:protoporphyrinogen oxidase
VVAGFLLTFGAMPPSPQASPDIADVLILGAGPAGLTAGYCLTRDSSLTVVILEENPVYVGGISRTERHNGFSFDVGGHRFFTKSKEIEDLWNEIMPQDFLLRPRLSRIYYGGKFYSYPLKAIEAFLNLGPIESFLCALSYLRSRLFPVREPQNFADWVGNAFGTRLFSIFFKTYTEKVWGMKCEELSADWAAQRIKELNLFRAVWASLRKSFGKQKNKKASIKTLTEEFHYPRRGPGQMWETAATKIKAAGGRIEMERKATRLEWKGDHWSVEAQSADGTKTVFCARHVITSAPLRETIGSIVPALSTQEAAKSLTYRDFIAVALMLDRAVPFKDNWIYIHDPKVLVGRIQNFGAWSPDMLPTPDVGCLGFEYFCFEGDDLWRKTDDELIEIAKTELKTLNLVEGRVTGGYVIRQPKAYPVYDDSYAKTIADIRQETERFYPSLHFIGRNGMHHYDNQDHAMMTAVLTVKNILCGKNQFDVWSVNEDAAYHEESS